MEIKIAKHIHEKYFSVKTSEVNWVSVYEKWAQL